MVKLGNPDLDAVHQGGMATTVLIDSVDDCALERELRILPPTNYADALRRIQEYNGARGRSHDVRHVECHADDDATETRFMKLEERQKQMETRIDNMEELLSRKISAVLTNIADIPKKLTEHQNQETRACSYCRRMNHLAKDCHKRYQVTPNQKLTERQDRETRACNYCQRVGHLARYCFKQHRNQTTTSQKTTGNDYGLKA